MRRERPPGVLLLADHAEVQPLAIHIVEVTKPALVDQGLELANAGVVLQQVSDHELAALGFGQRDELFGLGDGQGHRLFDVDVLAGLEGLAGQLEVGGGGGGYDHRVDAVAADGSGHVARGLDAGV